MTDNTSKRLDKSKCVQRELRTSLCRSWLSGRLEIRSLKKQILIRLLCKNVTLLGSAPVRRNHWMVFLICLPRSELQPVIKGLRKLLLIIVVFWMQAWLTASIPSYQQAVSASMLTLRLVKLSESTPCGIVYTWKLVGLISFSTAFCSHCGETLLLQPYAILDAIQGLLLFLFPILLLLDWNAKLYYSSNTDRIAL